MTEGANTTALFSCNKAIQRVKKKRPQQSELIERELEPLYS